MRLAPLRYLHLICFFMDAIKSELLSLTFQSDCEDVSSYQTVNLLLQKTPEQIEIYTPSHHCLSITHTQRYP